MSPFEPAHYVYRFLGMAVFAVVCVMIGFGILWRTDPSNILRTANEPFADISIQPESLQEAFVQESEASGTWTLRYRVMVSDRRSDCGSLFIHKQVWNDKLATPIANNGVPSTPIYPATSSDQIIILEGPLAPGRYTLMVSIQCYQKEMPVISGQKDETIQANKAPQPKLPQPEASNEARLPEVKAVARPEAVAPPVCFRIDFEFDSSNRGRSKKLDPVPCPSISHGGIR
jgi:hypothetical protein